MKLQNLAIIFIIIIIPIVLIFSLYLKLEIKTITLQTDYDEKLIEATKEAIEAFEINTTEWNNEYSTLANSKRRDIMASINTFTTSLSNKMGISGTSKESILTYVPAIVYTMYDGYYIYAPTYVPQTITDDKGVQLFYYENSGSDGSKITTSATQNIGGEIVSGEPMYVGNGLTGTYNDKPVSFTTKIEEAEKTYKHILKTFVPYSCIYENYTINYTLDNYIRIYREDVEREGYIINPNNITIPVNSVSGIKIDNEFIKTEILSENIPVRKGANVVVENYKYIYNSNNDKRYYDGQEGKFFTLNKINQQVFLPDTEVGTTLAEYKKVLVRPKGNSYKFLELYQVLNSESNDTTWYYINSNNEYVPYDLCDISVRGIEKYQDCSAINFFVENYEFNYWLKNESIDTDKILSQKNQVIIDSINNNLRLSLANYSANSKVDYKLPELTDEDWEQALSNISMITFLQGQKIGLKTYNNYVVVSSTQNNEYVSQDYLYYITNSDNYYHRYGCTHIEPPVNVNDIYSYKNTDFKAQSYDDNGNTKYYYKHYGSECFYCIVNRNNYDNEIEPNDILYMALARERYIQMQRTRLTKSNAIPYGGDALSVSYETEMLVTGYRKITLTIKGGSGNYTINWQYKKPEALTWTTDTTFTNKNPISLYQTYNVWYEVKDNVTGETVENIVGGEINKKLEASANTNPNNKGGTDVEITISGGKEPYKYKSYNMKTGTWITVDIKNNPVTVSIPKGVQCEITVFDDEGNSVNLGGFYGGAQTS